MTRSNAILLLVCSMLLRSIPSFADTCEPRGLVVFGGQAFYDHVANGEPASTSCWQVLHVDFVTDQTSCGPFSATHNAFQFNDSSHIQQWLTIPSDMTSQSFDLAFMLDFKAPFIHGGQNYIVAEVFDQDGTPLAFQRYDGTMANVACQRMDLSIPGNLAGHSVLVRFTSQRRDTAAFIRVFGVAFFQGPL